MDRDKIALEFMKVVLSSKERFLDYVEDENIMESIASDAYKMADAMVEASKQKEVTVG
jgi:hypothetical protein